MIMRCSNPRTQSPFTLCSRLKCILLATVQTASSHIARRLGPLLPELFQPALDINDVHDWPFNRL